MPIRLFYQKDIRLRKSQLSIRRRITMQLFKNKLFFIAFYLIDH